MPLRHPHTKIFAGFVLVALLFGFALTYDLLNQGSASLTGFVTFEGGVRVSTEKLSAELIQEISIGEDTPRVVVVLEDTFETQSTDTEIREEAIAQAQQQVIEELNEEIDAEVLSPAQKISSEADFAITEQFESINALAGTVNDPQALIELTKNDNVKKILLDYPVAVSLDTSAAQINAPAVWSMEINETIDGINITTTTNITGAGETVCIIDTGIDYTHPALGGCNPKNYKLDGAIEELASPVESAHPYADNFDYTWTITAPGYDSIAAHFVNMSLEKIPEFGDTLDRIYVYDSEHKLLAIYKENLEDTWTPHASGDTLYVRLVSDSSVGDYGFYIDQLINGTTSTTMNWEHCETVIGGWDTYNNDNDPRDDHGHGTHVAGIIASSDETYRGIASGTKLIAVKALSSIGSGHSSDVVAGIEWCNQNAEKENISIISMSLGCDGYGCSHYQDYCQDDLTAAAIAVSNSKNISVFIAAGNSGWADGISNPACVQYAIPVGGVDANDEIRFNRGNLLHLLAPGTDITSTVLDESWMPSSGTSMATPHAAGAAALLQQYYKQTYNRTLTSEEVHTILTNTGKTVSDTVSGLNFSRIDVYAAITPVLPEPEPFIVTLNSPSAQSYHKENFYVNLSFPNASPSFIGYALVQNEESILSYNTSEISGLEFVNEINIADIADGNYLLIVFANNTLGQVYTENRSIILDKTAPVIESTAALTLFADNSTCNVTVSTNITESNIYSTTLSTDYEGNWTNYSLIAVNDSNFSNAYAYTLTNLNVTNNLTLNYQISAIDLADNVGTAIGNVSYITSESPANTTNTTANTTITSNSTIYPTTGTIMEAGSSVSYNVVISSTINLTNATYLWSFGDGTNSIMSSGSKQYNITGTYLISVNVNSTELSATYNTSIIVNDTLPPEVKAIDYLEALHAEKDKVQVINATIFDYSNISSAKVYINGTAYTPASTTNGTYVWSIGSLTAGSKNMILEVIDNAAVKHSKNYTYAFTVTSCSDGTINGDETEVDCGGSCAACAVAVEEAPVQIAQVEEQQVVTTASAPEPVTEAPAEPAKPINWTLDLKEERVQTQEKFLYVLGGIIILLLAAYLAVGKKN